MKTSIELRFLGYAMGWAGWRAGEKADRKFAKIIRARLGRRLKSGEMKKIRNRVISASGRLYQRNLEQLNSQFAPARY